MPKFNGRGGGNLTKGKKSRFLWREGGGRRMKAPCKYSQWADSLLASHYSEKLRHSRILRK